MRFIGFVLVLLLLQGQAQAETRVAMVIGNGNYKAVPALRNPVNDADLIAASLRAVGFDVVVATNADLRGMQRAILDFGRRLRAGGPRAVGLFYFAGHGVQARGTNYLIPVGAEIRDQADLDIEAVAASDVLSQMESAGNALNLVILDACRNNPYGSRVRSASRGLARVQAASGTLIAFAAAPGQVAEDGTGANSPYSAALARTLGAPGLTVEQVFKRVRATVERDTGGRQTPWEESSLKGEFYFVAPDSATVATVPRPGTPPGAVDREALFWETIKRSQDPADFEGYLAQFPEGTFAVLARNRLAKLRRDAEVAAVSPTAVEVEAFDDTLYVLTRANVRAGPGTEYDRIGTLREGQEVAVTGRVKGKSWLRIALDSGQTAFVFARLLGERKAPAVKAPAPTQTVEPEAAISLASLRAALDGRFPVDSDVLRTILAHPSLQGGPPIEAVSARNEITENNDSPTYYRWTPIGGGWVLVESDYDPPDDAGRYLLRLRTTQLFALNGLVQVGATFSMHYRKVDEGKVDNSKEIKTTSFLWLASLEEISGSLFPIRSGNVMSFRGTFTNEFGEITPFNRRYRVAGPANPAKFDIDVGGRIHEIVSDYRAKGKHARSSSYYVEQLGIFIPTADRSKSEVWRLLQ